MDQIIHNRDIFSTLRRDSDRFLFSRRWLILPFIIVLLLSCILFISTVDFSTSIIHTLFPNNSFVAVNKSSFEQNLLPIDVQAEIDKTISNSDEYILSNGDDVVFNSEGKGELLYQQVLVPVTLFSSLTDEVTLESLQISYYLTDDYNTLSILNPEMIEDAIAVDTINQLVSAIGTDSFALVPFDQLTPELKVVKLDGQTILDDSITNEDWPFTYSVYVSGDDASKFVEYVQQSTPVSNRDTSKIGDLIMTGVTAISRGVEYEIEQRNDPIYPARGVMDVLKTADLTHVNSENPLFDSCIPEKEGIILCGKTRSIANFDAIGVDIIGLTGNHRNDYGVEKNLESIENLIEHNFEYYGGGRNQDEAEAILYKNVDGTTLAFMGYAYFDSLNGPEYRSLAYGDHPGANYYSEEKLVRDITEARKNADIVIVEYQFIENYSYKPIPGQVEVFEMTADLGADLVMGVQSHQPQWIRFHERPDESKGIIFYGLGNFFFDQMWSLPTRQALIPRFYFYDGKLISVDVMTTLLYDSSQPRFVEGAERADILEKVLPQ